MHFVRKAFICPAALYFPPSTKYAVFCFVFHGSYPDSCWSRASGSTHDHVTTGTCRSWRQGDTAPQRTWGCRPFVAACVLSRYHSNARPNGRSLESRSTFVYEVLETSACTYPSPATESSILNYSEIASFNQLINQSINGFHFVAKGWINTSSYNKITQ